MEVKNLALDIHHLLLLAILVEPNLNINGVNDEKAIKKHNKIIINY
jgi:hypothetical protein